FDVVIGNPPYVRQEGLGGLKEYLQQKYTVYHGMADLYAYFIEKGVSLLREKGIFGYIVANKWMRTNYGEPLRKWYAWGIYRWTCCSSTAASANVYLSVR
ncbi:MAG: Eco57I restriction-modification methylase domain-containing protein, partial [Planctomycetota bacterium]